VASGKPCDPNSDPCVVLAGIDGINARLAGMDTCMQQNNADTMVDFAKLHGINNKQALVENTITYCKHLPNALNNGGIVPSTPFCKTVPLS
jgi:hypothetical protein